MPVAGQVHDDAGGQDFAIVAREQDIADTVLVARVQAAGLQAEPAGARGGQAKAGTGMLGEYGVRPGRWLLSPTTPVRPVP